MKISKILLILAVVLLMFTGIAVADETGKLTIQVTDTTEGGGNPIDGATVTITGNGINGALIKTESTDGFYIFSGLDSKTDYTITVKKDGYIDSKPIIKRTTDSPVWIKLESALEPLKFYVRDEFGNGLEGITVSLTKNESDVIKGTTNKNGYVTLGMERNTNYNVSVGSDYYTYKKETLNLPTDQNSYTYTLYKAQISPVITVYNENKNIIPNANIYLGGVYAGTTDNYGKCQLPTLEAGTYPLAILATGYSNYSQETTFTQSANNLNVTLTGANTLITVTVKDINGNPLGNTSIYSNDTLVGNTNSSGTYTLSGNVGRTINISAIHDGYVKEEKTYTILNGENNVDFTLGVGSSTITITVLDKETGKVIPDAKIYVDDSVVGTTDSNGTYSLTSITGRTHLISAYQEGYSSEGQNITVNAGENTISFTLKKDTNILGIVIGVVAGILAILIILLILTSRKSNGFGKKKNKGNGKYAPPENKRDSL